MMRTAKLAAPLICLVVAGTLSSTPALAQQVGEITVTAPSRQLVPQPNSLSRMAEMVTLSGRVSFADLDLSSPTAAQQLRSRITETATAVCRRLHTIAPGDPPERDCVRDAVGSAAKQVQTEIAAAYQRKGLTPPAQ